MEKQLIKILELLAFAVSAMAFGYGAFSLLRDGIAKFFQLYVCAAGCYMLEELWVIVNSLLGNGSADGLITVRLFGFFGCLCFLISANVNAPEERKDEKSANLLSLIAPLLLLSLYAGYALSPRNTEPFAGKVIGFLSISPALFASCFSARRLLQKAEKNSFPDVVRKIDILTLIFYAANYGYPLAYLYCSATVMGICDLLLAVMVLGMIALCRKGASRWTICT